VSRGKKLITNTFILGIGTILPKISQFITLPIYTAMLSKSEYGTYDLVLILSSVLVPVLTLQIQHAAFRFLISERDSTNKNKIITNVYIFVLPIAFVSSLITFFILKTRDISNITSALMSTYLFLDIIVVVTRQISRGLGNNKSYSISSLINSFSNLLFVIIFMLLLDLGLFGLLISLSLSLALSILFLLQSVKILKLINIADYDFNYVKKMIKYSLPMVPNTLSLWVMQASDRLVITAMLGIEANAVYAVANKIPNIFILVYNTFNMAWIESASLAYDDRDSTKYYSQVFNALFNFLIGAMTILIIATPWLFDILIKGAYYEAYYQMPILYMGMFFSSLSAYYGGIYIASKKTKKIGLSSAFGAIINLILNLIFIKRIGIYAASISTLVSYLILAIFRLIDTRKIRYIQYKWDKIIFSLLMLALISFINYQRVATLDLLNLILGLIFALVINRELVSKAIKYLTKQIKDIKKWGKNG